MKNKKYIEIPECPQLSCERECKRRLDTMCYEVPAKDCYFKRMIIAEQKLEKIKEYINSQGIDNKWNMRIQRFRQEILQIIEEQE